MTLEEAKEILRQKSQNKKQASQQSHKIERKVMRKWLTMHGKTSMLDFTTE